ITWIRQAGPDEADVSVPVMHRPNRVVELAGPVVGGPGAVFPGPGRPKTQVRHVTPTEDASAPPMGEIGSMWPRERLYSYYENGNIFEQGPIFAENYSEMLRRDGKAAAMEQALVLPITSLDFSIEPQRGDKGEADFVKEALPTE